ncbi:alpha/beta hydrolase [Thalassotalea atypica]|uniref:alpha/beta hydrolase n=1 Tax=Thalassotalea atypica TaxID=2054316 RepID=UPI002572555D|nr:alpha/beta hydrolase [Thalassotalea atypica]
MRGVISPKLTAFLDQANQALAEAKESGISFSAERVRGSLKNLTTFLDEGPEIAHIEDKYLGDQRIPVRIYNPSPNETLPVLLHFHGGGHMCGDVEVYDPISRKLAIAARAIVICVDYRLAPEHPFPAGIDDCQYALEHYKKLLSGQKINEQLFIAGDSAGGAICTSLVMNNIDNDAVKIDKQVLIYPSVDYTMSLPSVEENGHGYLLERDKVVWYFQQYFQVSDLNDDIVKKASPLLGYFSSNMPESLVIVGGCDPLKDEGIAYAKALESAGVRVKCHQFPGMVHAFMLIENLVKEECEKTYQLISEFTQG